MREFQYVKRILSTGYEMKQPDFDLPKRGTQNSCGYDFFNPEKIIIEPGEIKYVKTGVKAKFLPDEMLMLCNRSSNPKKKGLVVINGFGIIEADYFENEDNDGELAFAFLNIKKEPITIEKNEKLGQGVFVKFLTTTNDDAEGIRKGGWGSTRKIGGNMDNKSKGNKFEENVAKRLSKQGYWATLLAGANHTGSQPADIIATKNNKFFIIDCKTLENKTGRFTIDRAESNQIRAYKKLYSVGSYNYFYYIIWENNVYVVPMEDIIHAEKSINVKNYPRIWRNFYENKNR